jgi:hypothetical protein
MSGNFVVDAVAIKKLGPQRAFSLVVVVSAPLPA